MIFFFKQKTAYEMHISDWSSDVCSSDLTKVFFFETPANPTMDVVDLQAVCSLAKEHGIVSVVDNAFATPVLQRPMDFGADVVAYSATKLMDGQGRVLAGAVCGSENLIKDRSEERRVGKGCVSTCGFWGVPFH